MQEFHISSKYPSISIKVEIEEDPNLKLESDIQKYYADSCLILDRLDRGDTWAWCLITLEVTHLNSKKSASVKTERPFSFKGLEDFRDSRLFAEMLMRGLIQLNVDRAMS